MLNTVIFDLDGTLLDTLDDLTNSVNYALNLHGLEPRSKSEIRFFLGNGMRFLMKKAVGDDMDEEKFEKVYNTFRSYYELHCYDKTSPYPGIINMLEELSNKGVKMAVVSNKAHPIVQELSNRFFKDYISFAVGESVKIQRKPNPCAVLEALKYFKCEPSEAIFIGDSEVDFETSKNAHLRCALVTWGFRDEFFLRSLKLSPETALIHNSQELLRLFQ